MDAERKAKWCTALRSGEYKQGKGFLKTLDGEYCCLGVLAELDGQLEAPDYDTANPAFGHFATKYHLKGRINITVYHGLQNSELSEKETTTLVDMNDDDASFPEIADWIEANL